ncbi:MAG: beta-ketoacyl-[acyl-carrier-protein] synthase family protein, partial [Phycisphaerae bacterium]
MTDRVVITGMGIVSPIGRGERAVWDALYHGRSGARPVEGFDTSEFPRSIACQVRDAVPVDPAMGRASALAVTAARDAVESASLDVSAVGPERLGVIVGTTMGETVFIEERLDHEDRDWLSSDHCRRIDAGRPGCIARHVQADLGATGMAMDLYGACAAGNIALATARRHLLEGRCDVILAGGADGFSRLAFIGFMRLRVMAAGVCRPFDKQRDGLLVGEGAVLFVLERESAARARGATLRAVVSGTGVTCENYHPTRPHPDGDGLTRSALEAMHDAGMKPDQIDYVCAHGTGTPQNDAIEVKVMQNCFPGGVAFSSVKALT